VAEPDDATVSARLSPCVFVAALLALGGARRTAAQGELQGRVIAADSGSRPLAGAVIAIARIGKSATSDSSGRFRLVDLPAGAHAVVVRLLGFRAESTVVEIDADETVSKDFALHPSVTALEEVNVTAPRAALRPGRMADFYERKAVGIGHFIDRELLEKNENRRMAEILAGNVPGLRVRYGTTSSAWATSTRVQGKNALSGGGTALDPMDRAAGAPRNACYLDVYLDGALIYDSAAPAPQRLFDVNSIQPSSIEAVEVYTGAAQIPAKYNRTGGGCGVMLIWTR
jgi:hypothetical protein